MSKRVYVILAFHAHEPLWDLPKHLLAQIAEEEMRNAVPDENWVRRRALEGRDIYSELVDFAARLGAPVTLEATNELLVQIAQFMPESFQRLKEAYRDGLLYPAYGHAHHGHIALLTPEEVTEEIKLNQEFVHEALQAPLPKYRGVFPAEGSVDASKLSGIKAAGIDYIIFPHLSPKKAHYLVEGTDDVVFQPFYVAEGLLALPRHFPISQRIWRPITRWKPERVKFQGYLLGKYSVFEEEYQGQRYVDFPIERAEAVAEYRHTLEESLTQAPNDGLLLYIQDLELMDLGDIALEIKGEAWQQIRRSSRYRIDFVTPDQYIDEYVKPRAQSLGRVRFHQISWAPEIRPVLRADGHYPPLNAGPVQGIDLASTVFKKWPFIFWETGRYLVDITNSLLTSFGFSLLVRQSARHLMEANYDPSPLPLASQLALHSRLMKRACNWGWRPDEGRQKRPFLRGYFIFGLLLSGLGKAPSTAQLPQGFKPLSPNSLKGLERLPEVFIDTRADYLASGIQKQGNAAATEATLAHLDRARQRGHQARQHVRAAAGINDLMATALPPVDGGLVRSLLTELFHYCQEMFMATDHIQRAWGSGGDVDALVIAMYEYLYQVYPPLFPGILASTLTPQELDAVDQPALR